MAELKYRILKNTLEGFLTLNPVLKKNDWFIEIAIETDTLKYKVGDNITRYSDLNYKGVVSSSILTKSDIESKLTGIITSHSHEGGEHTHLNKTLLDSYTQTESNLLSAVSLKHSNTQDHTHTNKTTLDGFDSVLKANYDTSYTHSQNLHASSNAQKNSDITKEEIETKLTGTITSHSHLSGGLGYAINVQALTSSPADGATVYFGMLPKAPITTANVSKVYIRKAGTIKIAEIYCYSGTAGTNENWSLYIRKNNSSDTLIATLGVATNERIFSNTGLSIPVSVGDYIEIKGIQPTWATNPATCIYGGYIYIE